jgi:hypothetical protein
MNPVTLQALLLVGGWVFIIVTVLVINKGK